jgi:hypothetical protein
VSTRPHFGHVEVDGHKFAVHLHTTDHHPDGTRYQRINKRVALWLTANIGTMSCFWLLVVLCLIILPSVLFAMGVISKDAFLIPFLTGFGFELMMTWIVSTCFQALCLPALMVGQNLQNEAADARAAKTFEDTEAVRADVTTALDRLDIHTDGGIKDVLDAIASLRGELAARPKRKA